MDIGRSFSYVFEDQEWLKKVLIGGIVNLIPIVNFAATGYFVEQTKRTYEGRELPLPEWDNFGGYFVKGLMTLVAGLIYSIPALVIYCCVMVVPSMLGAGASGSSSSSNSAGPLAGVVGILAFCGVCLMLLYGLVVLFFFPALLTRYALTDQFGAFFQFGPAWQLIQTNIGSYVIAVVVYVVASMIASFVGSIACVIGVAWTSFWAYLVFAYLFGSFARGTAAPVAPASMTPISG